MKKIKFMRLASVLLVLCLLTTCAVSGTFAKYTTDADGADTARVAKFGVVVAVDIEAFAETYTKADGTTHGIATTVAVETASAGTNLVAPGTAGTLLGNSTVAGTPEVAVNIKREATLVLTGWEVGTTYYCPIVITINRQNVGGTTETQTFYGMDYANAAEFIAAVEAYLDSSENYAPNTNLAEAYSANWAWAFEPGADDHFNDLNDDELDTALGNQAAAGNPARIEFAFSVEVTQLD